MIPECQLFGTLGCHLCEVAESVLHRQGSDGEQKAARRTFLERLMLRPL